jgi:TetR/AcrR family transcriptional regulator, tetracycline repressor protein
MPRNARIDRRQIAEAALALLDEQGVSGLTMRALAQRLGVQAPSLYNHVAGKAELQQLVTDTVWSSVLASIREGDGWRALLEQLATGIRAELRRHPGAAQVVAVTDLSEEAYGPALPLVAHAFDGLADDAEMVQIVSTCGVLAIGLAAAEFGDAPNPPVAPQQYYDDWFELAVGTLMDGLAVRFGKED